MNNKEKYISPELEIIVFDNEDVIIASGDDDGPLTQNSENDGNGQ